MTDIQKQLDDAIEAGHIAKKFKDALVVAGVLSKSNLLPENRIDMAVDWMREAMELRSVSLMQKAFSDLKAMIDCA